jgi:hypothetical protein
MLDINIDGLKDDSSWRRLGSLLYEVAVSDERLEKIRARLMARLYDGDDRADDALD